MLAHPNVDVSLPLFKRAALMLNQFSINNADCRLYHPEVFEVVRGVLDISQTSGEYPEFRVKIMALESYSKWKRVWDTIKASLVNGLGLADFGDGSYEEKIRIIQIVCAISYSLDDLLNDETAGFIACTVNLEQ